MPTRINPSSEQQPFDANTQQSARRARRQSGNPLMQMAIVVLVIALAAACLYFFIQYRRVAADPAYEARIEAERISKELAKVMVLPDDSLPVVATVSDREALQDQSFFRYAENGDRVVIFPGSMRAVLYRPSTKQVVDMAPLSTQTATTADVPAPAVAAPYVPEPPVFSEEPSFSDENL